MMESGKVPVDGGEIYYESSGSGIPVVFIHAGYLDCRMWDEQFALFSNGYNVIRYDVRGFGRSSNPVKAYSDAADLKSLLDHLKIKKAVLIGVSNGGRISFDFAVENPERVLAMAPMDFGISGFKTESPEEEHIWDMESAQEGNYQKFLNKENFREAASIDVDLWTHAISGKTRERVLEIATDNARKSTEYQPSLQTYPDPRAFDRLGTLKMPMMMILGEKDTPGSLLIVNRVHGLMPESELVVVHGADHIASLSRPEEFNRIVGNFLAKLGKN